MVSGKATGSRVIEGSPGGRIGWFGGNCRTRSTRSTRIRHGTHPHSHPPSHPHTHKVILFKHRRRDCKQGNDFVLCVGVIGEGQLTLN